MKKLIITTCVVLSMAVFPMSNALAKKGNDNPGNPNNNGVGGPPVYGDVSGGNVVNNVHNANLNYNRNVNRNVNHNYNSQKQAQGQVQGQAVVNSGNSSIAEGAVNNVNNNYITVPDSGSDSTRDLSQQSITMRGERGFSTAVEMHYPELPTSNIDSKNANVQDAKVMTMYKDTFTRAEVEKALNMVHIDRNTNGEEESTFSWGKKKDPNQTIKVVFTPPAKELVVQTALITTTAKNGDTESKDVLYTALLRGLDTNADLLLITNEGAGTIMKSFGWGIGFSYNRSTISTDEQTGGVSSGGLGISGGKAGYKSLPWIQAIGLKLK